MSTHCIFKLEGRRYGDGHATYAQIVCGYCEHTEWHIARDSGVAVRVFRSKGWKVGNKENQHRCPLCFARAKAATRQPDNPAIPREVGKAIKEQIMAHNKEELMGSSILVPKGVHAMPHPEKDQTADAPPIVDPDDPPPRSVVVIIKPVRGTQSVPGRTVFKDRHAAAAAGSRATGSVDGIAFFTMKLGDGWTYKLAINTTEAERTHWRSTRKLGPRVMPRGKTSRLPNPPTTKEETPMPTPTLTVVATEPTKDPMASIPQPQHDPRQPTRDERSTIHDALTKDYDIVQQRYSGAESDQSVATRLNVPRAWVTDLRTMFFGDHDRNSQTDLKIKELDAAYSQALAAATRLMEMATEAETLAASLRLARQKLGG